MFHKLYICTYKYVYKYVYSNICYVQETHIRSKDTNRLKMKGWRGAWVIQVVKCPTLAQVMISWFMGSSPMLGSVLTAQSLEPASCSVSPSLSAPSSLMLCLSLSQK